MKTTLCPYCGQSHPAAATYCPQTGLPLSRAKRPSLGPSVLFGVVGFALLVAGGGLLIGGILGTSPPLATLPSPSVIPPVAHTPIEPVLASATASVPTATPTDLPIPTDTATSEPTIAEPSATPAPPAATATPSAPTGHIVFVSYRDKDDEIYVMRADGTDQTRLTFSPLGDTEPALSPDGRLIAFISQRSGGHKLFIMNADGSNVHQLTDGKSSDEYKPHFSPDGQWIVYASSRGARFELWIIHPDGTGLKQVTSGLNGKSYPTWSPDGQWIAYNSLQNGEDVIKVTRPDGTGDQVVMQRDEAYVSGWIGDRIVFVAAEGSISNIFTMNLDGSNVQQLTNDPVNAKGAVGTLDGRFIIFSSARTGNDEIYFMQADGAQQTRLTTTSSNNYQSAWGP